MIHVGTSELPRNDPEIYNVALYLIKWLEPIRDTGLYEPTAETISKLHGNHLTEAIAYWTGIPESLIIERSYEI